MSEASSTNSPDDLIPQDLADNYDLLVADQNRTITYESIAANSEASPSLAAWARSRAAADGKDITPHGAKTKGKSTRAIKDIDYEALTVDELETLILERDIDATGFSVKQDYVSALITADEK